MKYGLLIFLIQYVLSDTLLMACIVALNGVRYPQTLYNDSAWVPYPGEITNTGKRMAYVLGMELKNRYASILDSTYNPYQTSIYSDEANYTDMFAQAVALAFYPTSNNMTSYISKKSYPPNPHAYKSINSICPLPNCIQPLPIKMIAGDNDFMFNAKSICPVAQSMIKQHLIEFQERLNNFDKENATMFKDLSAKFNCIVNSLNIAQITSYCYIAELEGYTLGVNLSNDEKKTMEKITNLTTLMNFYDPDNYARLIISEMINNITYTLNQSVTENDNSFPATTRKKLAIYITNQEKFISILRLFVKISKIKLSAYGSTLIIELHCNSTKNYWLKIRYNDAIVSVNNHMNINLKEFGDLVKGYMYRNLIYVCNSPLYGVSDGAIACATILEIALLIIVIIHLIILGIDTSRKWKQYKKNKKASKNIAKQS